jgi:hypothetical protein
MPKTTSGRVDLITLAKRTLNTALNKFYSKHCKEYIVNKKIVDKQDKITKSEIEKIRKAEEKAAGKKAKQDEKEQKEADKVAAREEARSLKEVKEGDPDPQDINDIWNISRIYCKTALLNLEICDEDGIFLTDNNTLLGKLGYNSDTENINLLLLECQILRDSGWGKKKFSNIYDLVSGDIDTKLENGIYQLFDNDNRVITNNAQITNNPKLTKFREALTAIPPASGKKRKLGADQEQIPAFLNNALSTPYPAIFGPDNWWPETFCNIPTYLDGWGGGGCTGKTLVKFKNELGSFKYIIKNKTNSQNYIMTAMFRNGYVDIKLDTTFPIKTSQGTSFYTNREAINIDISDKKKLSAGYVIKQQLQYLITTFTVYLDNNSGVTNKDLWEWFRINNGNMLKLMNLGGPKSFGDINQENSALIKSFYSDPGMRTRDNDRYILQAGTDRPSALGRATVLALTAEPDGLKPNVIVGYSTNVENFFYVLQKDEKSSKKSRNTGGKTLKNKKKSKFITKSKRGKVYNKRRTRKNKIIPK